MRITAQAVREALAAKLKQLERAVRARKEMGTGLPSGVAPPVPAAERNSPLRMQLRGRKGDK